MDNKKKGLVNDPSDGEIILNESGTFLSADTTPDSGETPPAPEATESGPRKSSAGPEEKDTV